MGGEVFTTKAQYDHGHAGYSGTIAEKDEFVVILLPQGMKPTEFAEFLLDRDDSRVSDTVEHRRCWASWFLAILVAGELFSRHHEAIFAWVAALHGN